MKEILILNLTRFGDLIQTTPLLRILRRNHPKARITLAALKGFSGILPLIRGYDRTVIFDKNEAARRIGLGADPLGAYRHMDEFVRKLEGERYDLVVNLTCDRMSAYLVSTLQAGKVAGIMAANDGQRVISGIWGTHLFSVMQGENRRLNRINLVDIGTMIGGGKPDGSPVELHESEAGRLFAERFITEAGASGDKLIGIQLGASEAVRCWPVESFARLCDLLQAQAGVRVVLFGSPGEKELAQRAMAAMGRAPIDAVGKTGIAELFSLVRRCALLVTNDTGTMHFAAAGGTPVVMLSIGPAFFHCTGPYSAGNLALQPQLACSPCAYNLTCHDPVCRDILSVEAVHSACRLLGGENIDPSAAFPGLQVCKSLFGADGYLTWEPLCPVESEEEELAQRYARLWKNFLNSAAPPGPASRSPLFPELELLTSRGMDLTARIMEAGRQVPLDLEKLGSLGEQETAVEARIKLLGSRNPAMAPLVDFLTLLRENITSEGLTAIARETRHVYEQGNRLAARL